jgi:hypothetical protein
MPTQPPRDARLEQLQQEEAARIEEAARLAEERARVDALSEAEVRRENQRLGVSDPRGSLAPGGHPGGHKKKVEGWPAPSIPAPAETASRRLPQP